MDVDFRWRQIPKNLPDILLYDLQWLRTCDTICLLHDWGESSGARAELAFATGYGNKSLRDEPVRRVSDMGTKKEKIAKRGVLPRKHWTDEEQAFVERNFRNLLQLKPGRSSGTVST